MPQIKMTKNIGDQMKDQMEYIDESNHTKGFFAGLIAGGLAGAGVMLLFAPQSGEHTRKQIRDKSVELRDQTVQSMDNAVGLVKTKTSEIVETVKQQAGDIQQRGQEIVADQKRRWSPAGKAIKNAVQE
jgi:gas vesicle protein